MTNKEKLETADMIAKLYGRIKELEAGEKELRWKPIEALPENIRDGVERIYANWTGQRFTSFTRSQNREWLTKGGTKDYYTHYFELPIRP